MIGFGAWAASAQAALVCASPQELKVLQSAALQQQLMVAALSCHMSEDYNRFVAAFRVRLIQSDQALKAFFAARPRGEDYNAYKTRIANRVSLRSLHDGRFCDSAQKVFDMALGRVPERNGLAPEPPQMIETGYEGCRPAADKLIEANVAPRPAAKVAMVPTPRPTPAAKLPATHLASLKIAKPAPAPRPVVTPEAAHALALRSTPKPVAIARVAPLPANAAPKPAAPKPVAVAVAAKAPAKVAAVTPPSRPQWDVPRSTPLPPRAVAPEWPAPSYEEDPALADAGNGWADGAASRWPNPALDPPADDPVTDDHVPNAYRPGAEWVGEAPPSWRPARAAWSYPPPPQSRWRRPPPRPHWVLTPDGRWMVVIGRQPRWVRD